MKKHREGHFTGILILLVLVWLGLAAGFSAECWAARPDQVAVAILADQTGPYITITGPAVGGLYDAIKYINEELGGIHGVEMKAVSRDNAGKVALGLQQYAELIGMKPKPLFFHVPVTPIAESLREKIIADNVIGFFPSSIADLYPQGNSYAYYALYTEQAAVGMKWVKDNFKEKRNPRVGILTWDTAFGRAILEKEFFDYCKQIGVDIVATELFGVRDVDVTTQMVRIRAQKPDWLLTNIAGSGPVVIMKAVKELGMDVKLVNCIAGEWGTVLLDPGLFEGCVTVMHCASFDDPSHPGIKKLLGYMDKNNRTVKDKTNFYLVSWQYALLVHKVTKDAVTKVGWDKLDVPAIKNELNRLTDFEPLNGLVKMTYTDKRRSSPWLTVFKVTGGKFIDVGGGFVRAPDLRPGMYR
jgi:branched-chain amino acid transport system substrate-binding protein